MPYHQLLNSETSVAFQKWEQSFRLWLWNDQIISRLSVMTKPSNSLLYSINHHKLYQLWRYLTLVVNISSFSVVPPPAPGIEYGTPGILQTSTSSGLYTPSKIYAHNELHYDLSTRHNIFYTVPSTSLHFLLHSLLFQQEQRPSSLVALVMPFALGRGYIYVLLIW